jgi:transcriptional regulator with XRE-family HTH domain
MTTPGEMLEKMLKRKGIEKTELGRRLGVGYLAVNRWTKNQHFNAENQARVAAELELDANYFTNEMERTRRERAEYREAIFKQFSETKVGRSVTADELRDLNKLPERITVTVEYLQATVLAMRGLIPPKEVWRAVREQRKLLKGATEKKPRPKG